MYRKELLDARRALRNARDGVSGPMSKKKRGEWERVSLQNMYYDSSKTWIHKTHLIGTPVMEVKTYRSYTGGCRLIGVSTCVFYALSLSTATRG